VNKIASLLNNITYMTWTLHPKSSLTIL